MAEKNRQTPHRSLIVRFTKLHVKLVIGVSIGAAVILLAPYPMYLPTRLLLGWNVGVAIYLMLTHAMLWRATVPEIRRRASEQDEGASAILALSIAATLASTVAIVFELGGSKQAPANEMTVHVLLAMSTILLSWLFMHTIFSLHYAHEFYGTGRDQQIGGLIFPGDKEPDYRDFLYFSLVIGMTSQTSDVGITSKFIRRMAAVHGFLSFFFNLTVLALTVNMVSNLL